MKAYRDTLFRYLTLLQLIPRSPGRIATPVLLEKLRERGFSVDQRSLQRDLKNRLALHFPLICDDSEKPYRWFFDRDFHCNLPALDLPSALTLVLVEDYLKALLPPVVAGQLAPQFADARQLLDNLGHSGLSQWVKRVRAIPNGKALIPATVSQEVWQTVTQALLDQKLVEVNYLSRSTDGRKQLTLHPQGMVARHSTTYLLAIVDGYTDIRQFALHRICEVITPGPACQASPEFDIDNYINSGAFTYRRDSNNITLVADIAPNVAWLLNETPLSTDQILKPLPKSDWHRLEANVEDDQQTLWWLMGLGANVDILQPTHWREEIIATAKAILERSNQPIPM